MTHGTEGGGWGTAVAVEMGRKYRTLSGGSSGDGPFPDLSEFSSDVKWWYSDSLILTDSSAVVRVLLANSSS